MFPTLFTLTSVFLGFLSLVSAADGKFVLSALSILFASIFDSMDGSVARATRTESQFGIQLDSLADVISFGIAPAVLAYLFFFEEALAAGLIDWGMIASFVFVAGGTIRLARFNVQAGQRGKIPKGMFIGLPIPCAAGLVAGLVFALSMTKTTVGIGVAVSLMVAAALLMVSPVIYRKRVSMRLRLNRVLIVVLGVTLLIVALVNPPFVIFAFFAFYAVEGLIENIVRRLNAQSRRARLTEKSDRLY